MLQLWVWELSAGGVAEILLKNANTIKNKNGDGIQIKYVLDLRDFPGHPLEKCVVHDINVILNDPEVTIVAELMGGAHPAYEFFFGLSESRKKCCYIKQRSCCHFWGSVITSR